MGRTEFAVRGHYKHLTRKNPTIERYKHWTAKEDAIIQKYYTHHKATELIKKLPGRSADAIKSRAAMLGVKKNINIIWSDEEIKYLECYFNKLPLKTLAIELNRSEDSVRQRIKRGFNMTNKQATPWTEEEDAIIRDHYITHKIADIADMLGGRNIATVRWRAHSVLGLRKRQSTKDSDKPWTAEEDEYLKENYKHETDSTIAKYLNRSVASIKQRLFKELLLPSRNNTVDRSLIKYWTEAEDTILKTFYETFSAKELEAKLPGRKEQGIRLRLHRLNLISQRSFWDEIETDYLCANYATKSAEEIACELDKTTQAVRMKIFAMKLSKQ